MKLVVVMLLYVCQFCIAQTPLPAVVPVFDHRPRLEFGPRLNLNGGSFQPVSASMSAGFGMENQHFIWRIIGTYNAAKKYEYTDLKDNTNPHGNIRSISTMIAYRTTGGWLLPVIRSSYAQLRTTNYNKVGWSAAIGIGKDFTATCPNCNSGPVSMRLEVLYSIPVHCYTETNFHCLIPTVDVEQAIVAHYTVPSPSETQRHVFWEVAASAGFIKTSEHGHFTHDGGAWMGPLFRF